MTNPWTLQKMYLSIGNTTITKKIRYHRIHQRSKIWVCPWEIWRFWKSVDPTKKEEVQECLYLLSFLKDFDDNNGWRKMSYFQNVNISKDVWQKWATHGSEQGWRSTFLWVSWGPQQHSEKCRIENVNRTADVWQKWGSSALGKAAAPQPILKIQS